ncbi:MAG TPA: histidinol-phosphatase HisJ family protein [Planctomycetota bacterium]|nr:histidinol-phosphatase HisJ family protein [Planctomycetota bacterium]
MCTIREPKSGNRRLPADLHMHSKLCGHAVGEMDEYVARAIELGLEAAGFSFHLPIRIPVSYKINVTREELDSLTTEIERLRAAYGERIPILFGGEADYLPGNEAEVAALAAAYPFDYLIASVHFVGDWAFDHPAAAPDFDRWDRRKLYETYFGLVRDAVATGLFDVVGHVDLIKKFGHRLEGDWTDLVEALCAEMRRRDVAMEINTAGFDKPVGEQYASEEIVRRSFAAGVPLLFGSDAHAPREVGRYFPQAIALARAAGYTQYACFASRQRTLRPIIAEG